MVPIKPTGAIRLPHERLFGTLILEEFDWNELRTYLWGKTALGKDLTGKQFREPPLPNGPP